MTKPGTKLIYAAPLSGIPGPPQWRVVSGLHRARDDANGVLVTIPESGDRPIVWAKWSNSVP